MTENSDIRSVTAKTLYISTHVAEYLARPEIGIASLLHLAYDTQYDPKYYSELSPEEEKKPLGISFISRDLAKDKDYREVVSNPFEENSLNDSEEFADALENAGLKSAQQGAHKLRIGRAVINSIEGGKAEKTKKIMPLPLASGIAALGNTTAAASKAGPFNIARQLQTFHLWGSGKASLPSGETAAERVANALEHYKENDDLLSAIDDAALTSLVGTQVRKASEEIVRELHTVGPNSNYPTELFLHSGDIETPFSWFYDSLNILTSEKWIETLPLRRWCDWVSSVFRYSLIFGNLWILNWNKTISEIMVSDDPTRVSSTTLDSLFSRMSRKELLRWESSTKKSASRNIASELKRDCLKESVLRRNIKEAVDNHPDKEICEFLRDLNKDPDFCDDLVRKLENPPTAQNFYEFIKYNLFSQEERGFQADLYGLCHPLKNNWILFDLGSEALALMASLCAREPGGETDLRSVVASFSVLGLKPSDEEVLLHLTKAGLATGAADADDAVKVKSAF